jgi:hypothetical protein
MLSVLAPSTVLAACSTGYALMRFDAVAGAIAGFVDHNCARMQAYPELCAFAMENGQAVRSLMLD